MVTVAYGVIKLFSLLNLSTYDIEMQTLLMSNHSDVYSNTKLTNDLRKSTVADSLQTPVSKNKGYHFSKVSGVTSEIAPKHGFKHEINTFCSTFLTTVKFLLQVYSLIY